MKIIRKVFLIIIALYLISVFVSQQKTLNAYNKEISKYKMEKEQAQEEKKSLVAIKENINSPEYIEEIAREKLGMYLPNERVFIDIGK